MPSRIAFSTLAFPDATLAAAVSAGRRWGYSGVELRLIDGELIDPAMPAADRAQVRRTLAAAGLPVVAVDSSIRLTGDAPGPDLRRFLRLASDWDAGGWSCSARARCRSGRCSGCRRPGATRTGSRWSGRSAGTPRSRILRWPSPSTWTC